MFPARLHLPGLGLAALLALVSLALAPYVPLSSLMLAMLLGLGLGHSGRLSPRFDAGLVFGMKQMLRLAIVFLGFRISLGQVQAVGWQGLVLLTLVVALSFGFTLWLGQKLELNPKLTLLLASGVSICGASAVVATDAVIEAEEQDCAYAVATITLFGTLAMVIYPLLQLFFPWPLDWYGLWVGASVHEVAQVVAAGFAHGDEAGQLASLVKLTRVIYLIPVMAGLLLWQVYRSRQTQADWKKVPIPWFVLGFMLVIGGHSWLELPAPLLTGLHLTGQFLLALAMAALGLSTRLDKLRARGLKPAYLGLGSSLFIGGLSWALITWLYA